MHCDGCGCELTSEDAPELDTFSEQIGPTGIAGAYTKTQMRWLCRNCANYRRGTRRMLWLLLAGIVLGILAIGLMPR